MQMPMPIVQNTAVSIMWARAVGSMALWYW